MSYLHTFHHESFRDMAHVRSAADLRANGGVPADCMYGDTVGGKSFTDAESAMLEAASAERRAGADHGWRETWCAMTNWTVIDCRPASEQDRREYAEALDDAG